jgi:hypothetical protein
MNEFYSRGHPRRTVKSGSSSPTTCKNSVVHSDSTNRSYLNPFLHKSQKRVIFPACHFDHVLFVRVHHPGLPSIYTCVHMYIYTCVHMYKYSFYICMKKYMIRDMHDDQTVDIQHTQQQQHCLRRTGNKSFWSPEADGNKSFWSPEADREQVLLVVPRPPLHPTCVPSCNRGGVAVFKGENN